MAIRALCQSVLMWHLSQRFPDLIPSLYSSTMKFFWIITRTSFESAAKSAHWYISFYASCLKQYASRNMFLYKCLHRNPLMTSPMVFWSPRLITVLLEILIESLFKELYLQRGEKNKNTGDLICKIQTVGCPGKKQREIKVCTEISRFLEKRQIEWTAVRSKAEPHTQQGRQAESISCMLTISLLQVNFTGNADS